MSIENQATFYYRNVCDYDSNIRSGVELAESIVDGFIEFTNFLRNIYEDWRSYETSAIPSERTKIGIMTDDLENYHNLTYTMDCLYALATTGELQSEGGTKYLSVNKIPFKNIYKQSATFSFKMLEKYSFYFKYFKGHKEVTEYKHCDSFNVYYENGRSLIESMKLLAARLSERVCRCHTKWQRNLF